MATTQKPLNVKDLSPANRRALLKQLSEELRKEKKSKEKLFDGYKNEVTEMVDSLFPVLKNVSDKLAEAKQFVYNQTKAVVKKKESLYETSVNNQSHTFTNAAGDKSITIGYRTSDGWDDTVTAGIAKVNKYISKITGMASKNKEVQLLKDIVEKLLAKDAQGNLKASRVLELKKAAEKINNKELNEGIRIIESAWKPKRTKNFISVMYKDKQGKQCILPLNMTDAEITIK